MNGLGNMLRLSIVVNMYNTARYMPKCMDSLLNQDIPLDEYEIILVDDGSPDNSLAMARDYASQYPNIVVCSHDNKGLAGARNTGLDAARGEYLCFVDPDDYVEKNSYAALLEIMDKEELDVLRFNYSKVDEQYEIIPDYESEAMFDYSSQIMTGNEFVANRLGMACYVWPYIYRLDFVRNTGIRFVEGIYLDDVPFLPRLLQKAQRVDCIEQRHQYYLQRKGSMVRVSTVEGLKKKYNDQMLLLNILNEQCNEVQDAGVRRWYRAMITHMALGLLNNTIVMDYDNVENVLKSMRELGVFPMSKYKATKKSKRKIGMINFSPRLYCALMKGKRK